MKLNKFGVSLLILSVILWALPQDSANTLREKSDSGTSLINRSGLDELDVWRPDSVQRFNPFISGASSLVLPGAGQIYTHHYVKAGFFLALEGIFGGFVYFWDRTAKEREKEEGRWLLLSADDTDAVDKALNTEEAYIARHGAVDARFSKYTYTAWAIGGYLFNVLDAVGSSNVFMSSGHRSAGTAALCAAVPGLGLGQLYNGSLSKAGLVMMGQISLGLMSYSSHRLMKRAEENYQRLNAAKTDTLTGGKEAFDTYSGVWSNTRFRAFTNRNMYLWYSIFFYGYSIFDAVVDAYLHEYSEKMKIEPDLVIGNRQVYFTLKTDF